VLHGSVYQLLIQSASRQRISSASAAYLSWTAATEWRSPFDEASAEAAYA
jgi:hypothetical protein